MNFVKTKEHLTTAIGMADTDLTELEADKQMEDVDSSTKRQLLGLRDVERLGNPDIDRAVALKEADL
ncbi:MAG: hypothetical protein KAR40_04895 [Candidatus Sabulitectum sp.]|nr:hypothetical protein [Candidatus Sabulitectum sp.]